MLDVAIVKKLGKCLLSTFSQFTLDKRSSVKSMQTHWTNTSLETINSLWLCDSIPHNGDKYWTIKNYLSCSSTSNIKNNFTVCVLNLLTGINLSQDDVQIKDEKLGLSKIVN